MRVAAKISHAVFVRRRNREPIQIVPFLALLLSFGMVFLTEASSLANDGLDGATSGDTSMPGPVDDGQFGAPSSRPNSNSGRGNGGGAGKPTSTANSNSGGSAVPGGQGGVTVPLKNPKFEKQRREFREALNDPFTCGQECLYQKANENIALQAIYLEQRLSGLEQAYVRPDGESLVRAELGSFCQGQDGTTCLERYRKVHTAMLFKIRESLARNYKSQSDLRFQGGEGAKGEKDRLPVVERRASPRPMYPYMAPMEEIEEEYKRLQLLTQQDYVNWTSSLSSEPSEADFVVFKEVPSDPADPNSQKKRVVEMENGKPKIDQKGFKKAHDAWKKQMAVMKKDLDGMLKDPVARSPLLPRAGMGDISKQAYLNARKIIVETVNESIKGEKNKKGAEVKRGMANQGASIPTPGAGANSRPLNGKDQKPEEKVIYISPANGTESIADPPAGAPSRFDIDLTPDTVMNWIDQSVPQDGN